MAAWFNEGKSPSGIPNDALEAYKKIAEIYMKKDKDKYKDAIEFHKKRLASMIEEMKRRSGGK